MTALLKYFRSLWVLIFHRREPVLAEPAPPTSVKKREWREPDTIKPIILEELSVYFDYLARMKRGDRDSYDLYAKIGAQIWCDDKSSVLVSTLHPWWRDHRPAFGAIVIHAADDRLDLKGKSDIRPKFLYFRKYKLPPASVQPLRGGDVYAVTVYWDALNDKHFKHGIPTEFPVLIDKECNLTVLKTLATRTVVARSRKGGATEIPQRVWSIPQFFENWASHHSESTDQYLKTIFCLAANGYADLSHSLIQIRAVKGRLAGLFSIDILKTPQFFDDRDTEALDCNGHRKKIFHIVRTHIRVTGQAVRTHFRGLRKFLWNGYEIEISVPFRDHFNQAEFEAGALDEDEAHRIGINEPMLTMGELGKKLERHRIAGYGAMRLPRRRRRDNNA